MFWPKSPAAGLSPPRPWQEASSVYSAPSTAQHSAEILDDQETLEGALPRRLQTLQVQWMLRQYRALSPAHTAGNARTVFDLACGNGAHLQIFADSGWSGWGLDINPFSIKGIHSTQAGRRGLIEAVQGDLNALGTTLPAPHHRADLVLMCYGTICTLPPETVDRITRFAWESLKPGGLWMLDIITPEYFSSPRQPSLEELIRDGDDPEGGHASGALLLDQKTYLSPWLGFWGALPKRVIESTWYYPTENLYCEDYSVAKQRFLTWKRPYTPQEYRTRYRSRGFLHCTTESGSFGQTPPRDDGSRGDIPSGWSTLVFQKSGRGNKNEDV